jgi:hypothetical protein
MVPIQYSSVRPGFQTIPLAGQELIQQHVIRELLHLGKFEGIEGTVRMKSCQRRIRSRVRHVYNALLQHAPSGIVPQHWSGEEQRIDAIQHAPMAR